MFKKGAVLFLYSLTPLHPGSGVSVGVVDLPIQRERHTKFPIIQASGVKGALRDLAAPTKDELNKYSEFLAKLRQSSTSSAPSLENLEKILKWELLFGPVTERASEHGGSLVVTDARILLFPVRSARNVFAWITCPLVASRLLRDLEFVPALKNDLSPIQKVATLSLGKDECAVPTNSSLPMNNKVVLEDFCFNVKSNFSDIASGIGQWLCQNVLPENLKEYWREKIKRDLVILSDQAFQEFVEMSTEVITRIKIGETGTVDAGPWDEECLPAETILYSVFFYTEPKIPSYLRNLYQSLGDQDLETFLRGEILGKTGLLQFGGDETVGRGLVLARYLGGEKGGF